MSRLSRRHRTYKDLGIVNNGGLTDLFDNVIKEAYRINDEEYDYISANITEEDMEIIVMDKGLTFAEKRVILYTLDKYVSEFKNVNK